MGITLVALVVTIIILIILATISINLLLGKNGILTKAKEILDDSKIASIQEEIMMAVGAAVIASIYPFDANQKLTWEVEGGEAEVVVRGDHNEDAAITFFYFVNYTVTIKNSDGSELDSKNVYVGAKSGGDDPWF